METLSMDAIWEAEETYLPKLETFAEKIRDVLEGAGFETEEPVDLSDENLTLWVPVNGREYTVELSMHNAPQMGDGQDYPNGVNFMLTLLADGGRLVGTWSPYNYTPKCWVCATDPDALERRWQWFKSVDLHSMTEAFSNPT